MALQGALLPEGSRRSTGAISRLLMIAPRRGVILDSEVTTAAPRSELCAESKEGQDASQDDS